LPQNELLPYYVLPGALNVDLCRTDISLIAIPEWEIDACAGEALRPRGLCRIRADLFPVVLLPSA
jgi:hypothetical protein